MMRRPIRGQGALEYLLLIGGAVLVATVILVITIGSTTSTTSIINENINGFTGAVSLNSFDWGGGSSGGGPNLCGTPSEVCTTGSSQACTTGVFAYSGTQSCNATCSAYGSCTTTQSCGDGTINGTETCDTSGNVGCSGGTPVCNACSICQASGGPSLPSATLTMVDGTVPLSIDIGYDVTSGYESGFTYEFAFDEVDFSPITTVSAFDALYANPTTYLVFQWPSGAQTVTPTATPNFVAGVTYYGVMKVCNSAGCAISNVASAKAGSSTQFANFQVVSGPTNISGGTADYSFSWTGNTCAAGSGTPGSAVVLAAGVLFPTGTQTVTAVDTFSFNVSDESAGGIYQFVPTSGSSSGRATNSALKLAAFSGETNPTFGIACVDNSATNYLLQSQIMSGTYPLDTEGPIAPALSPTIGSTNGGLVNLSWSSVADQYLGNTVFNSLVDDAASYIVAYKSGSAFSNSADFDAAISAGQSKTIAGASSPGTAMSSSFNYSDGIVPSQPYFFGIRALDAVDGKTTLTANSTDVYVSTSTTSSKEAQLWEAETFNLGNPANGLIGTGTYSGEGVLISAPGCVPANANVQKDITFLAPATPNTTYRVWVRGANTNAGIGNRQTIRIKSGTPQTAVQFVSSGPSTALAWQPTTIQTMALPGGLVTFTLQHTNTAGTIDACNPDLKIDKILLTSQQSCTPTGNGSNCT